MNSQLAFSSLASNGVTSGLRGETPNNALTGSSCAPNALDGFLDLFGAFVKKIFQPETLNILESLVSFLMAEGKQGDVVGHFPLTFAFASLQSPISISDHFPLHWSASPYIID